MQQILPNNNNNQQFQNIPFTLNYIKQNQNGNPNINQRQNLN